MFVCVVIYGYSAIHVGSGQTFSINVDLAEPISIVWPCEIAVVGDNGEKGLRIPPKVGRGWRQEAGGQASYKFYVPKDSKYHIWAYCRWFDVCSNAVFAQIDNLDKAIVGNDPIYDKWHWVRGFDVDLKKGTHTFILSNHSDHISLQKVLFTNSASLRPEDHKVIFSDIFYDGFDGCDQGNFRSWSVTSGTWFAQNPTDQTCITENALIGRSKGRAFIVYKNDSWCDYSLSIVIKSMPSKSAEAAISVCFGVKDPNQYYQLKIQPIKDTDKANIQICRNIYSQMHVLAQSEISWQTDVWHQVEIDLNNNSIEATIDDAKSVQTPVSNQITGGIGLLLESQTEAYFDDIHVKQATRM